jgi:hypothetical protein
MLSLPYGATSASSSRPASRTHSIRHEGAFQLMSSIRCGQTTQSHGRSRARYPDLRIDLGPKRAQPQGQRRSRTVAVGVEPTIRPAPARCLRCLPKLTMTELSLGANLGARRRRSARTAIHVDTLPSTVLIVKRHTGGRLRTPGRDLWIRRLGFESLRVRKRFPLSERPSPLSLRPGPSHWQKRRSLALRSSCAGAADA